MEHYEKELQAHCKHTIQSNEDAMVVLFFKTRHDIIAVFGTWKVLVQFSFLFYIHDMSYRPYTFDSSKNETWSIKINVSICTFGLRQVSIEIALAVRSMFQSLLLVWLKKKLSEGQMFQIKWNCIRKSLRPLCHTTTVFVALKLINPTIVVPLRLNYWIKLLKRGNECT